MAEMQSYLGNAWQLRSPGLGALPQQPAGPADRPGWPRWMATYLQARGLQTPAEVGGYLNPSLQAMASQDPAAIADMPTAVARLVAALNGQQRIVIYGDYDVDGVCACTLLVEFLRGLGGKVDFYIPHRRTEGYGPNVEAFARLAGQADLIVTVDCGSSAHAEVDLARQRGVDVIIVDHHQVPAELPRAVACLNPQRPDCPYPFKGLCATGVAFMLAVCLRRERREAGAFGQRPQPDLRPLLDLVALATVADMVPLTDVNRSLVTAGLARLRHQPRPGLQALCAVAKLNPATVDAASVGFKLGPRLNASGRMEGALPAVELLLCRDLDVAAGLAAQLDAANEARRQLQKQTELQALALVQAQGLEADAALVVHQPDWHAGVLGLVASRLASTYHRPALVIGEGGKGSGRSVGGFDLHAALDSCAGLMQRFGGHKAAAGVTVDIRQVGALRAALAEATAAVRGLPPYPRTLCADAQLEADELHAQTWEACQTLEPFGQANPQPLFWARGLQIRASRLVGNDHLKLQLRGGAEAIGFGMGHLAPRLPQTVDAAGYLEINRFANREVLQLRLCDLRPS
jgi:single-stranded-DNA-specific exonuclease